MVKSWFVFITLCVLSCSGKFKQGNKQLHHHTPCGRTVTKELTIVEATVSKTCGIRPTTVLPACLSTPPVEQTDEGSKSDFARKSKKPAKIVDLESSEEMETEEEDHLFETRYWSGRRQGQQGSFLRAALNGASKHCPPTSYSTTLVTKTVTLLSSYICSDSAASALYPNFSFCDGVTLVTCGTVPPGRLNKCPAQRSSKALLEDYAPSDVHMIEETALPVLLQGKKLDNNVEARLAPSFSEYAADFLIRDHYKHVFGAREGGVKDIITQTVPYKCQGPTGFQPAVPPCTLTDTFLKLNCTIIHSSTSGEFYSPNYPKNYIPNSNACWTIVAPEGYRIQLVIQDFLTEKDTDILRIYDGMVPIKSPAAPVLLSGLGNIDFDLPFTFTSTSNYVYLKFYADGQYQFKGFEVDYYIIPQ